MMSCVPMNRKSETGEACANCGTHGSDTVKLKNCTACRLVKYCGVDCQRAHRKQHKKTCKQRAAELEDKRLYSQGHERSEGDFCPLCTLAIPPPLQEYATMRSCCVKTLCDGCCLSAVKSGLGNICPFCRTPPAKNDEEALGRIQKRVAARDPEAIRYLGDQHYYGECGLVKDASRGFELWSEAADLGSLKASSKLGMAYYYGKGVAEDEAKGIRYLESAAMQGSVESRYCLGCVEEENGNVDRAVRHFLISAKLGLKQSLDKIKDLFSDGHATRAQYAEGLQGYQDAVEEMKSPARDEAAALGVLSRPSNAFCKR